MTIKVYLDTTKTPPVTVDPQIKDKAKGKDTITWKPGKDQDFTFVSLTFTNNPSYFGPADLKPNGKEVTVDDDNSGGASVGDFPYTVVVSYNDKEYSSATQGASGEQSDAVIRNRP